MNRKEELESRIATLEAQLEEVEGTPTEIYTRIVGYYRSLKNWNRGKREEYRHRRTYDVAGSLGNPARRERTVIPQDSQEHADERGNGENEGVARVLFFSRTHCPKCPAMRHALEEAGITAEAVDVDEEEGFELARRHGILATPTVVMLNEEGEELRRVTDPLHVSTEQIA
ncbi:MAG: anaerobic ribonucleoside-triphosphate reductase [Alkalispirochaetaceae bacterium]